MRKWIIIIVTVCFGNVTNAQDYNPDRYRKSIFPDVLTIADVKYGEAPQRIWPYWDIDLELDVYSPDGDSNPKRPLIIFAHSGGFINGSKEVDNMMAICDSFAQKGFVTASIDYRKGFDPLDAASAERAVYRGVQDGKAAVRYFKQNASLYDLDTNYFFFAGMSAGGYISLHVAYMDKEEERPTSTYGGGPVNDLECLDCAGNSYPHSSYVRAILDFWGGVDDTTLIEEGDIPMMIMHGENDETVPFVYGHPFGLFTLPESYGGQPISERAENMGIHYELFTSEGTLHMLDGSENGTFDDDSPNAFWSDTLLPESERFLYELMKPNTERVTSEDTAVCAPNGLLDFEVTPGEDSHFIWDFDEDAINLVAGEFTNLVTLEFMEPGDFEITVVEFNEILCAGDTISFQVEVQSVDADFSYDYIEPNYVSFTNLTGDPSLDYTWYFGDGETSTEFEPDHVYESIGDYDVRLFAVTSIGCQDTSLATINVEALGIEQIQDFEMLIYPNPVTDLLTISNEVLIETIEITDAAGHVVYRSADLPTGLHTISTSNWSTGIYFIVLQDDSGKFHNKKLMKK